MVTFVKLFCQAVSDYRVIKVALVYSGQWQLCTSVFGSGDGRVPHFYLFIYYYYSYYFFGVENQVVMDMALLNMCL